MLKQNPDKIIWGYLSRNINPEAVEMLKKTPIRLTGKSRNTNTEAIKLLAKPRKN
jgi:hypothetical protein